MTFKQKSSINTLLKKKKLYLARVLHVFKQDNSSKTKIRIIYKTWVNT